MIIKGLRGYRASMGWVHTNGEYVFVGMDDTGRCWYLDSITGENLGSAHIEGDWARGQKVPLTLWPMALLPDYAMDIGL